MLTLISVILPHPQGSHVESLMGFGFHPPNFSVEEAGRYSSFVYRHPASLNKWLVLFFPPYRKGQRQMLRMFADLAYNPMSQLQGFSAAIR